MRKLFILSLLFITVYNSNAQELLMDTEDVYSPDVKNPEFPGGYKSFYEFVYNEFDKTTPITKEGDLIVSFTINVSGEMKNIRVLRDIGDKTAFEIIRVLRLSPKWTPAIRNGKPFETTVKLPFRFVKKKPEPIVQNNAAHSANMMDAIAQFEGGRDAFYNYIYNNVRLPGKGGDCQVIAKFVINTSGNITDIEILKDPGFGIADDLKRVLKNCPKWRPAYKDGKPVNTVFTLPLTFKQTKN